MTDSPACGDYEIDLKLDIDERIEDVKFKTYGWKCNRKSSTLFVDMLIGKTIEEAKQIKDKDIADTRPCHQSSYMFSSCRRFYQKARRLGRKI